MPISPEREALIWRLVNDEWDDESELASFFTSVCDPAELHMFASYFNWDAGPDELQNVVAHPLCDLGTVLLVYWRGRPTWYQRYESRDAVSEYELEAYDFLRDIEKRVLAGQYRTSDIAYDPRNDLNQDQTHQALRPREVRWQIPAIMYQPTGATPRK